jgi:probable HAF family extracellular repeat protein
MNRPILTALIVVALGTSCRIAYAQYTAYKLGGSYGQAFGINNSGTIIGYSHNSGNVAEHAFSYSGGVMTDLGSLAGFDGYNSCAYGINNSGIIVGVSRTSSSTQHAFRYTGGGMTDLGTLGGAYSQASGINSSGTVVGWSQISAGALHGFSYSSGLMTDLGTLPGGSYSEAYGINDSGTIVGIGDGSAGSQRAFSYSAGVMTDLGTLGGAYSQAYAINSGGTIVGYSYTSGNLFWHAFSYVGGLMTDLGTLGGSFSQANALNSSGTIVGYSYTSGNIAPPHAFSYNGGVMIDLAPYLTSIGITGESRATAINDNGDIVGWGEAADGYVHAFALLVPEPSAPTLLALGLVSLLFRRRSQVALGANYGVLLHGVHHEKGPRQMDQDKDEETGDNRKGVSHRLGGLARTPCDSQFQPLADPFPGARKLPEFC